jgi:hypothetical protein
LALHLSLGKDQASEGDAWTDLCCLRMLPLPFTKVATRSSRCFPGLPRSSSPVTTGQSPCWLVCRPWRLALAGEDSFQFFLVIPLECCLVASSLLKICNGCKRKRIISLGFSFWEVQSSILRLRLASLA